MRRHLANLLLTALVVSGACADRPVTGLPAPPKSTVDGNDQLVALGIALALGNRDVRELVRDDMRASPWTEHKLVLQEYVQTPGGRALVRTAAERLGMSVAGLDAAIGSLPPLDFYLPSRAQRLAWRGTPSLVVSSTLDPKVAVSAGFTPTGSLVRYDPRAIAAHDAHFLLEPAERKGRRHAAQPATRRGATIQDPDDGEMSMRLILWGASTDSIVVDYADYATIEEASAAAITAHRQLRKPGVTFNIKTCEEDPTQDFCQEDPPPPPSSDYTRIDGFWVTFCDLGYDCRGGNEVEWKASYKVNGVQVNYAKYRQEGVSSINHDGNATYYPRAPIIYSRVRENAWNEQIDVELVETDWGGDDHYGWQTFQFVHNGQWRRWPDPGGLACGDVPGCYYAGAAVFGWAPKY